MKEFNINSWSDFKQVVLDRAMIPQWQQINGMYYIYGGDGYVLFEHIIYLDGGVDQVDFEANYKDAWNQQLSFHDNGGIPQIVASPRPPGMTTYYSSAGDNGGIGSGNEVLFDMLSTDVSKTIDITYNEDVYIKDGTILPAGAPMGAKLDILIVHPVAGVVGSFCRSVFINGSTPIQLNSEDKGYVPLGLILRFVLYNATGTNGYDAAADFKMSGIIEMYRINTV
jgi:hypothetical protein